jgi:hypothetical protein
VRKPGVAHSRDEVFDGLDFAGFDGRDFTAGFALNMMMVVGVPRGKALVFVTRHAII